MVLLILILMLILLTLIVLASAQCPGCLAQNCTISQGGFSNCSACMSGYMLISNVVNIPASVSADGNTIPTTVYSCQACPSNCLSCSLGLRTPSVSSPFMAVMCDNCPMFYVFNFTTGGCAACPANCQQCGCWGDLCQFTGCYQCMMGYVTDNNSQCIPQPATTSAYSSPYCQQGAATMMNGQPSCPQCQYGAAVPVSIITTSQYSPIIQICQLCPTYCLTCEYIGITTAQNTTQYILGCTACVAGTGFNAYLACVPCPQYCQQCDTLYYGNQNTINCIQCDQGFTMSQGPVGQGICVWDGTTQVINAVNPQTPLSSATNGFLLYSACPFCQPGACSMTATGLGNCSQCSRQYQMQPILFWAQTYTGVNTTSGQQIYNGGAIGICRQCAPGCASCSFQASNGAIVCTSCNSNAVLYPGNNSCVPCSANCASCAVSGNTITCNTCNTGYSVNYSTWPTFCSPSSNATSNLQDNTDSNGSNTGTIVGLSIWGAVMTIVAAAFLYLWYKKSENAKIEPLLNNSEPRTVSF